MGLHASSSLHISDKMSKVLHVIWDSFTLNTPLFCILSRASRWLSKADYCTAVYNSHLSAQSEGILIRPLCEEKRAVINLDWQPC